MKVYPGNKVCNGLWYLGGIEVHFVVTKRESRHLPKTLVFQYKSGDESMIVYLRNPIDTEKHRKGESIKSKIGNIIFEIKEIHEYNYGLIIENIEIES